MLGLIPAWLKLGVIGLAAVALVAWGAWTLGKLEGRQQGRLAQMEDTIEAHEKWEGIEDAVSNLGDYDLCIELGGLPDQCEQLRRMDEAAGRE